MTNIIIILGVLVLGYWIGYLRVSRLKNMTKVVKIPLPNLVNIAFLGELPIYLKCFGARSSYNDILPIELEFAYVTSACGVWCIMSDRLNITTQSECRNTYNRSPLDNLLKEGYDTPEQLTAYYHIKILLASCTMDELVEKLKLHHIFIEETDAKEYLREILLTKLNKI